MLLILLLLLVHLCLVAATCLSDLNSLYVHLSSVTEVSKGRWL